MAANIEEEGNMAAGFALYNWQRTREERLRFPLLQRYYETGGFHTIDVYNNNDGHFLDFNYMRTPPMNRLSYVTRNFPYKIAPSYIDMDISDVLFRDPHQFNPLYEVYERQNAGVGSKEVWLDCYYPLNNTLEYYRKPKDGQQHLIYLFQLHTYLDYAEYYNIGNHVRITEFTEYQFVKIKIQDYPGEQWALPEPIDFPHGWLHRD